MLLADADAAALSAVAERMRVMVKRTRMLAGRVSRRADGLDRRHADRDRGDTAELIVRRADALLYASKHAGRNRVMHDAA